MWLLSVFIIREIKASDFETITKFKVTDVYLFYININNTLVKHTYFLNNFFLLYFCQYLTG